MVSKQRNFAPAGAMTYGIVMLFSFTLCIKLMLSMTSAFTADVDTTERDFIPMAFTDTITGYQTKDYPLPQWVHDTDFIIEPALVLAIIKQESNFNSNAVSSVGANGLMQIMPKTAQYIVQLNGEITSDALRQINDPQTNIKLGQNYLLYLANKPYISGNLHYLLAAYNAGPGNLIRWQKRFGHLPANEFVLAIPFKETRDYVAKVIKNYHAYKKLLLSQHIVLASDARVIEANNS